MSNELKEESTLIEHGVTLELMSYFFKSKSIGTFISDKKPFK